MPIRLFRLILEVGDLDRATDFYTRLLATEGRPVGGGRVYFDCGVMILALLKPDASPTPIPEYLYFAVDDLEAFHARAKELDVLSKEDVHGESAGEMIVGPWRERSFYAFDPWGNGHCFVDDQTLLTGRR